jgi:O-antigen/teichoic acid export membrane protein
VPLVLGDDWKLAVPLIQVLGLSAAVDQIGFNWTAFARARGETRWLAVATVVMLVPVLAVGVPLLLSHGVSGFAIGIAAGTAAGLVVRIVYLSRLFPAASMVSHVAGAIVPTLLAAGAILVARAALGGDDSALRLVLELAAYVALVVIATWITARPLLREAIGYVRGGRGAVAGAAT